MLLTFIKNISDVRVSNVIQSSKVAHLNLHFTTVLFSSTFKGKLMTALNVFDFLHQFKRLKEFNRYNTTKSLQLFMMLDNTKRGRIWPAYKIKRSVLKACMSVRIFWSVVLFLTKSKSFELKKWRYRSESNSKRVWEEVLFITSPFFIEIAANTIERSLWKVSNKFEMGSRLGWKREILRAAIVSDSATFWVKTRLDFSIFSSDLLLAAKRLFQEISFVKIKQWRLSHSSLALYQLKYT